MLANKIGSSKDSIGAQRGWVTAVAGNAQHSRDNPGAETRGRALPVDQPDKVA